MGTTFNIDDKLYRLDDFSPVGKELIARLVFVMEHIKHLKNNLAVLNRAKNAYMDDLKLEAIEEKSGINIADLFSSD